MQRREENIKDLPRINQVHTHIEDVIRTKLVHKSEMSLFHLLMVLNAFVLLKCYVIGMLPVVTSTVICCHF